MILVRNPRASACILLAAFKIELAASYRESIVHGHERDWHGSCQYPQGVDEIQLILADMPEPEQNNYEQYY